MKKIWKGLFYCVWHADKAPVQSELINRLSSLLLTLDLPLSLQYFSVFLLTLRREWSGIDALRLDKFYLLIRRFVNSVFQLLRKNDWDLNLTATLMGILEKTIFLANDMKVLGNGVSYHIVAVFLEELKGFLPVRKEVVEILLRSLFSVMGKSQDKILIGKIKANVFDLLLKMGRSLLEEKKKKSGGDVGDVEMENLGTVVLVMGFAAKFYELGSSTECFQGNRKVLFGLHEQFLKLEKDLEISGVVIEIPVVKPVDDEEVPELIPIVNDEAQAVASGLLLEAPEVAANGGVGKSSKKNKRAKKGSSRGSSKKIKVKSLNDDEDVIISYGESSSSEPITGGESIDFSKSFKSNLQMEFEKVAEEEGLDKDGDTTLHDSPEVTVKKGGITKKRKRARSVGVGESDKPVLNGHVDASAKSGGEKSEKKVRFAIKNNLVWKPQSPLPPQSVRIPPSVTPRGSALKKGVPPGPIRQMPTAAKRVKSKKARKVMKTTSPATKRQRKLQGLSV